MKAPEAMGRPGVLAVLKFSSQAKRRWVSGER
jgi:hypothetical protein